MLFHQIIRILDLLVVIYLVDQVIKLHFNMVQVLVLNHRFYQVWLIRLHWRLKSILIVETWSIEMISLMGH